MRTYKLRDRRSISPQKVVMVLKEHGNIVNINEAELILDLTYKFAKLSNNAVLNKDHPRECPEVKTPRKIFYKGAKYVDEQTI